MRKDIILSENLAVNISNKIDINALYKNNILKEGEEIANLRIIFEDLVQPGFRIDGKILLKGQVKKNTLKYLATASKAILKILMNRIVK